MQSYSILQLAALVDDQKMIIYRTPDGNLVVSMTDQLIDDGMATWLKLHTVEIAAALRCGTLSARIQSENSDDSLIATITGTGRSESDKDIKLIKRLIFQRWLFTTGRLNENVTGGFGIHARSAD